MPVKKSPSRKASTSGRQKGYCVKCRDKRVMLTVKEVTMKNGRHAMKGSCEKCSTGMYKITGN